jgi:serine phosphatase RsbU (regulator of sigma subunit)/pSer/pThr/pTyr-binding forkhead associated (FHA) protein
VVPAQGDPYDQALEEDEVVVGRSSQCQVTIADRFLSRRHARLLRREDGWCIEDLGSRNGTLVNGRVIEGTESLAEGDEIQISGSLLRVLPESPDAGILTSERGLPGHTVFRPASDLLVSQGSIAPTERSSVDALQRYSDRLQLLNDLHQALSRPMALDELLKMILLRAFEDLRPEEGVILLKDGQGGYRQAAHRSAEESTEPYLISETLVREVVEKGLAALVLDVETDERFGAAESIIGTGIRSLIASPLQDEEGTLGMIALSSRLHRRQFKDEDLELLTTLGSIAALRIRNVALAEEAAERRRLATELKLARQIQVALLPDRLPTVPGWEIYAATVPSRGVSGDFYEVLERAEGRDCVLIITDVSGKGIGASLLTASLEALLIDPIETGHPPDAICARVGRRLFQRTPPNKYATAIIGVLDPASGRLHYTNAGHNQALLIRSGGEVELLGPTGTPLGLLPNSEYTAAETSMLPGDLLLLYTDGITEAANPAAEEYGLERLAELCRRHRFESLDELAQTIESELDDFVEGVPYADDRTVVIARRSEGDLS